MEFSLNFQRRYSGKSLPIHACMRSTLQDFQVDEILGFEPDGEGEHIFLQIEKRGQNTLWVKEQVARNLGLELSAIGHAGMKDRHAICCQWLSVHMPAETPNLLTLDIEGVEVLRVARHPKKLRPGNHKGNKFKIRLTDVMPQQADGVAQVEAVLTAIRKEGFPNYFGDQRFGHQGGNLTTGWALLQKRKLQRHRKKSIYLSALRSWLFNRFLDQCLLDWPQGLESSETDESWERSGPLWGRGRPQAVESQREYEYQALKPWQEVCNSLEYSGLQQARRHLLEVPENLVWSWIDSKTLELEFSLGSGAYATSLLREFAEVRDVASAANPDHGIAGNYDSPKPYS